MSRFSGELKTFFFADATPERVRLEEILQLGGKKVFGFLLAIIAFPCALPIPHFGLPILLGLVLAFFAVQILLGKRTPWLPSRLNSYAVKRDTIRQFLTVGLPWIERIEAIAKPRYSVICSSVVGRLLIGSMTFVGAMVMTLPFPGTNIPPAIGIFITGIGLLEEDGLICLVGLGICLFSLGLGGLVLAALLFGGFGLLDGLPIWVAA